MATPQEVLESVKEWNLVQVKEFVDAFCEEFDVDASAPAGGGVVMAAAPAAGGDAGGDAPAAEKTEFNVHMKSFGGEKIKVIKEVRGITGLGLKEAKEKVEAAPCDILEGVPKEEAEKAVKALQDAGAEAEVK